MYIREFIHILQNINRLLKIGNGKNQSNAETGAIIYYPKYSEGDIYI